MTEAVHPRAATRGSAPAARGPAPAACGPWPGARRRYPPPALVARRAPARPPSAVRPGRWSWPPPIPRMVRENRATHLTRRTVRGKSRGEHREAVADGWCELMGTRVPGAAAGWAPGGVDCGGARPPTRRMTRRATLRGHEQSGAAPARTWPLGMKWLARLDIAPALRQVTKMTRGVPGGGVPLPYGPVPRPSRAPGPRLRKPAWIPGAAVRPGPRDLH